MPRKSEIFLLKNLVSAAKNRQTTSCWVTSPNQVVLEYILARGFYMISIVKDAARRRGGRPRKPVGAPVEHRMTPRVKQAVSEMVECGLTVQQAADIAGLTASGLYKALRLPPVQDHYVAELRALRLSLKSRALHALAKELDGENAAARVSAARSLLEGGDAAAASANSRPQQMPGFSFLLVDNRGNALPSPVPPLVEHDAPGDIAMVSRRSGVFRSGATDRD
jgi:hypothetical protein